MKVLVVTSSPNAEGLTAACGESARQGVVDGNSPARVVNLNDYKIERCAVCENGWGPCKREHRCRLEDDFAGLKKMFEEAEGHVWVTPVYFGEPSESFRAFFDRLRRCEATKSGSQQSALAAKPVVCVAAAGGSGHGAVQCLSQMERLVKRLAATPFDFIPITQKTREYQLETIHDALVGMCTQPPPGRDDLPLSARRRRRPPRRRGSRPPRGKPSAN
ncbi:MAG: flavodoxin family protein [Candidatus Bipolaricaulia bacterium]